MLCAGYRKDQRQNPGALVLYAGDDLADRGAGLPAYYFFKLINLYDNLLSVILTAAALSSSFGTYLLASVFRAFDKEIIEAAMIDGCNKLILLVRIVVPTQLAHCGVLLCSSLSGTGMISSYP